MLMPPLTYIHASEAARTTAGGRGVGGGRITPPTACKWLKNRRGRSVRSLAGVAAGAVADARNNKHL